MSCNCCEPEKHIIQIRKLNIENYFQSMVTLGFHPSCYWEHPIVAREIEVGIQMVIKRNPDLKSAPFTHDFSDHGNKQEIYIQI